MAVSGCLAFAVMTLPTWCVSVVMGSKGEGVIVLEREREMDITSHPSQDCVHSPRPQCERVPPQKGEPASNGREKHSQKCVAGNEGEKKRDDG